MLLRTCRATRQVVFGDVGHSLKVLVTGVAEMRGAEAEEDGDGTAVATLVLEEVGTVLSAHLNKTQHTSDVKSTGSR